MHCSDWTSLFAISSPAWADPFGIASAYNVVALTGNVTAGSDIGGRVAAAGTILSAGTVAANPIANDTYGSFYGNPFDFVSPGGYSGPERKHQRHQRRLRSRGFQEQF